MDVREKLAEIVKKAAYSSLPSNTEDFHLNMFVTNLLSHGVTVQEWISVEDRLPKNDQKVLCFNYNGEYKVLRWNYIDWMWNSGIEWLKEDYVLYWMPLPEPPEEVTV